LPCSLNDPVAVEANEDDDIYTAVDEEEDDIYGDLVAFKHNKVEMTLASL
jgi:hypothetical protein